MNAVLTKMRKLQYKGKVNVLVTKGGKHSVYEIPATMAVYNQLQEQAGSKAELRVISGAEADDYLYPVSDPYSPCY